MNETTLNVIKEGDFVIIKFNNALKCIQLKKKGQIRIDKVKFYHDGAIGQPWGTSFEVHNLHLVPAVHQEDTLDELPEQFETIRDNRNIQDMSSNQKLEKHDIQALKKGGTAGQAIISHLIENSSTFSVKTEYSQQKYIKKKKKKHITLLTFLQPCSRYLAEMIYSRGPRKICNLRPDSLAQVLTYSNVHANSRLMVCESMSGLLVGALLERMAGMGCLIQFYYGTSLSRPFLSNYNFPSNFFDVLLTCPLHYVAPITTAVENQAEQLDTSQLIPLSSGASVEDTSVDTEDCPKRIKLDESIAVDLDMDVDGGGYSDDSTGGHCKASHDSTQSESVMGRQANGQKSRRKKFHTKIEFDEFRVQRKIERSEQVQRVYQELRPHQMDGLIVGSRQHPTTIVLGLIDFVAPSRPIVVFSQFQQPLMDLIGKLKAKGNVINIRLSETWFRQYQVLPNRTHPEVNMDSNGGYILSCTTVSNTV